MDLSKCFDTLDHEIIIKSVSQKVSDGRILKLIKKFLKVGVMETGIVDESIIGCLQGGVISPLLMNIYLDYFDKETMKRKIRIVRYADDILIFVKTKTKTQAGKYLAIAVNILERKLKLKVNNTKTYKSLHKAIRRRGYKGKFKKISMSSWKNSNTTLVNMALPNIWFKEIGLVQLSDIHVGVLSNYYE